MKDFNEFMKKMDSRDWEIIANSVTEQVKDESREQAILHASMIISTTILREYHIWANSEQQDY